MTERREVVSVASLLRLLGSERAEVVCGAALVLGALKPADRRVVPGLARALDTAPTVAHPYLLNALSAQDDPRTWKTLLPRLLRGGTEREQAVRAVAEQGEAILDALLKTEAKAVGDERIACLRALVQIDAPAAVDALITRVEGAPDRLFDRLVTILSRRIPQASVAWKRALSKGLLAALPKLPADRQVAILRLLGPLKALGAVRPLLELCRPTAPAEVRPRAVEALGAVPVPVRQRPRVAATLIGLLDDPDEPIYLRNLALAVLRAERPCPIPFEVLERLLPMDEPHFVRSALRLMAQHPKERALPLLLQALEEGDDDLRGNAQAALAALPEALPELIAAHDRLGEIARARLRRTLDQRADVAAFEASPALVRHLLHEEEEGVPFAERLQLLAIVDRDRANAAVLRRARAAVQAAQPDRAIELLEPLVRFRLASPDGRYQLAVAHLLVPDALPAPGERHHDRARNLLGPLARLEDWSLSRALARERRLPPERLQLAEQLVAGTARPDFAC